MNNDQSEKEIPHCKKTGCVEEADVMLHGRFPFCEDHYLEAVQS